MTDPIQVIGGGRYLPSGLPSDFFDSGKISSTYLPSYVDDVLEYDNLASFPGTGETGKIYVAKDSGIIYRWSGSTYVAISSLSEYLISATNRPTTINDTSVSTNPISVCIQKNLLYLVKYSTASGNNLTIYDISNRTAPVLVSNYLVSGSVNLCYAQIFGTQLYVLDLGANTLFILDVSNPSNPSLLGSKTTLGSPRYFVKTGNLVYVASWSNGLIILDATDPINIKTLSTTTTNTNARSVVVEGSYAYVANYGNSSVSVVNVANPLSPTVASTTTVGTQPHHIVVRGKYMYVLVLGENKLKTYDISNPASPASVGTILTFSQATAPYSAVLAGEYLYISSNNASGGLVVVSLSDPLIPVEIARITVGSIPAYSAIIGRYLYIPVFSSNKIITLDIKGLSVNSMTANTLSAGSANILDDLSVDGTVQIKNGLFVGQQGINSIGSMDVGQIKEKGIVLSNRYWSWKAKD